MPNRPRKRPGPKVAVVAAKPSGAVLEVSQREIAEIIGVSVRQVRYLMDDGLPAVARNGDRVFPVPAAVQWYLARKVTEAKRAAADDPLEAAKIRKMTADADRAELETEKLRAEVVTVDYMAKELDRTLQHLRGMCLAFPGRHAPELVGCPTEVEARKRLDRAMMEEMATMADSASEVEEDEAEEGAP